MDVIESFLNNLSEDPARQELLDKITEKMYKDLDKRNKGYITQKDLHGTMRTISRELYGIELPPSNSSLILTPLDIPELQKDKINIEDFKKLVPYILMAIASEVEDETNKEDLMLVGFVQKKKKKGGRGKK